MSILQNISKLDGIELSRDRDERIIRDNQWVRDINGGCTKSFEAVYKCYYPQLFNFLRRYIRSESVIEDIIQQVFYKVWQNREQIEPRGTLKAYLYSAVRNQAFKHLDKENRNGGPTQELTENCAVSSKNPENKVMLQELHEAYQAAVDQLPDKRKNIFLMHRQDNLTYKEIADVLNISIRTVETQMRRSLKFLATRLSNFIN